MLAVSPADTANLFFWTISSLCLNEERRRRGMKRTKRRHPLRRAFRLLFLLAALAAFLWWSSNDLQVCRFDLSFSDLPQGFDGCRAVVLADTHGKWFGDGNQRLFDAVAAQRPEYIFFLGDLEDSNRGPVPGYPETLADGLSAIAPTYYVTGNHEWANGRVRELKQRLRDHGMVVLSNQFLPLERNGSVAILAGIDDPNGFADQKRPEEVAQELYDACGPDPFWILLAHRNNRFFPEYSQLGADLVLSGHAHGGVIRLPFIGGLIDHDRGLFAPHSAGVYEHNGSTLFVTRGLGNSGISFRLFNRPEVAVLEFHRQ